MDQHLMTSLHGIERHCTNQVEGMDDLRVDFCEGAHTHNGKTRVAKREETITQLVCLCVVFLTMKINPKVVWDAPKLLPYRPRIDPTNVKRTCTNLPKFPSLPQIAFQLWGFWRV
jgi:hypothetical protein